MTRGEGEREKDRDERDKYERARAKGGGSGEEITDVSVTSLLQIGASCGIPASVPLPAVIPGSPNSARATTATCAIAISDQDAVDLFDWRVLTVPFGLGPSHNKSSFYLTQFVILRGGPSYISTVNR